MNFKPSEDDKKRKKARHPETGATNNDNDNDFQTTDIILPNGLEAISAITSTAAKFYGMVSGMTYAGINPYTQINGWGKT